jgi:hypothetical protein
MAEQFGFEDVRIGEALYRCQGHCLSCCELYVIGRVPDALLQGARPMTDVLPWLETELRSCERLRGFMSAVSTMGAQVRKAARPRYVRKSLKQAENAVSELLEEAVGETANAEAFLASAAVALLEGSARRYEEGVGSGDLGAYQSIYGSVRIAIGLLERTGMDGNELSVLSAGFPSVEPPARLLRPGVLAATVERLGVSAYTVLGAQKARLTLGDALSKVDRLLDDVLESYGQGVAPLAARLAASLYIRSYDPIRSELASGHPEIEFRMTDVLARDLRQQINVGAPVEDVRALVESVKRMIASVSLRGAVGE